MGWRHEIFPPASLIAASPNDDVLPARAVAFVWKFARKLKVSLIATSLAFGLGQIIVTLEPLFIGKIIGAFTAKDADTALNWIIAYIIIRQLVARLMLQIGHAVENHYMPLVTMFARRALSNYLFKHSYGYFQDEVAGRLAGKVIEMPNAVSETIVDTINNVQPVVLQALTGTILFTLLDWRFGLISLVFYLLTIVNIWRSLPELERRSTLAVAKINVMRGSYIDSISNILLVKLFARRQAEDARLSQEMVEAAAAKTDEQRQFRRIFGRQHLFNAVLQIGVIFYCYMGWHHESLEVATIITALALAAQLIGSIWTTIVTATTYFARFATIQEGLDTIIQPHAVTDGESESGWQVKNGNIVIRNIAFAYPTRPIFKNFSFAIPAGQKIGLIGPSGAGKSTLIQLLLRLHDVQTGTITIDGQNIAQIAQDDLRRGVAMLPQQADLLHRSIADNIRYGRLDATDAEVEAAARQAQAHDFILQLPQGYASLVGERGVKLSGGQRQRIAIARAFLKDAPILILDEPTAALDSESERLIQQSLTGLMEGRTVIVIAHRLSTIAHLDRIVVLEAGKIVEDGTHTDLLAQKGLYHRLWSLQSDGFIG